MYHFKKTTQKICQMHMEGTIIITLSIIIIFMIMIIAYYTERLKRMNSIWFRQTGFSIPTILL